MIPENETEGSEKLVILWTSGEHETAEKMICMYAHNAMKHGWWETVLVIVWGAAQRLLVEDAALQEHVREMAADGVEVAACKACADQLGAADQLAAMGVDVRYTGKELTGYLKEGIRVLSI